MTRRHSHSLPAKDQRRGQSMPIAYLPAVTVADIWRWRDTPIPPCATVADVWALTERTAP